VAYNLAITGTRDFSPDREEFLISVLEQNFLGYYRIYFGGAVGVDTEALKICRTMKTIAKVDDKNSRVIPELVVVYPDTMEHAPNAQCRNTTIRCADKIIQLRMPIVQSNGWRAYHNRNEYMVNHSVKLLGFPFFGRDGGGAIATIKYAKSKGKEAEVHPI